MRKLWLLLGLLALALVGPTSRAADRPNVLFILSDDQRFDTIRALGNPDIQTPNLDKLVERGFVFTNAFCQGSMVPAVCLPSRTMILTGRSLFHIPDPKQKTFDGVSLPKVFNAAGYETCYSGKYGNSFPAVLNEFNRHVENKPADGPTRSLKAVDVVLDFLKERKGDKPFFVHLAPHVPHDPRTAEAQFMKLYDPAKIPLPKNFMAKHPFDNGELEIRDEKLAPVPRTEAEMKKQLAEYYACITGLDHHVGRILDALKQNGQLDNTLVVFTSDQGLAVGGRHGLMGKQNLYEHVKPPLVVAGPGIPKGKSEALVYLYDLFPTLCECAKITVPKEAEGKSLVPVIAGKQPRVRDFLFAAYRDCQRMVRDEQWKLLWYPKIDRFQLFDVKNDPWELNDLADKPEQREKLAALKKRLSEEQKAFDDNLKQTPK